MKTDFDENLPITNYISLIYRKHNIFLNKKIKDVNLTFGLYPILITIYKKDDIIQEDLAKIFHLNQSTITRNLDKLEKKEFIKRTPHKRKKIINLTPKGEEIVENIIGYNEEWDELIKKEIGYEEFNNFKKTLIKISKTLIQ